jgi:predicted nucleic acid-binding protein
VKRRSLLDSFAVVAWLQNEPGARVVAKLLVQARAKHERLLLHEVNLAEVYYLTIRRAGEERARSLAAQLQRLPIQVVASTLEILWQAARLKATHPISIADAFAAATAILMEATLVTGDPELRSVAHLVEIHWI